MNIFFPKNQFISLTASGGGINSAVISQKTVTQKSLFRENRKNVKSRQLIALGEYQCEKIYDSVAG